MLEYCNKSKTNENKEQNLPYYYGRLRKEPKDLKKKNIKNKKKQNKKNKK